MENIRMGFCSISESSWSHAPSRLLPAREIAVQSLDLFLLQVPFFQECDLAKVVRSQKADRYFFSMTLKRDVPYYSFYKAHAVI